MNYNQDVAVKYGINCAVLLQNIYFWVQHNQKKNANYYDGYYWTYNSVKRYSELIPELSPKQIRTALAKLQNEGLIICANYNDVLGFCTRTLWYSITQKGVDLLVEQKGTVQQAVANEECNVDCSSIQEEQPKIFLAQKGKPICPIGQNVLPSGANNKKTYIKQNIKTTDIKERKYTKKEIENICVDIFAYWNSLPLIKCFSLDKTLKKAIISALEFFSPIEIKHRITNYVEILTSDFWFDYKWSLKSFLTKPTAMREFGNEDEKWLNYQEWLKTNSMDENRLQFVRNLTDKFYRHCYSKETLSNLVTNLDNVEI